MEHTIVGRIKAAASAARPPRRGFEGRLPPEVLDQLLELRRQFQSGELNVSAVWLADQIVDMAAADGFKVCGNQGLRSWLARRE